MDGVEPITRLRALDRRKGVPIVMVAGSTDLDNVVAALGQRRG
jgi:DNA-binding response OmpR family regulator